MLKTIAQMENSDTNGDFKVIDWNISLSLLILLLVLVSGAMNGFYYAFAVDTYENIKSLEKAKFKFH